MPRLNISHESTGDAMYTHPEISRLGSAQRIRDMHGRADVDRQLAQARQAPRPGRIWMAWLPWLSRRTTARRAALGYPAPRNV